MECSESVAAKSQPVEIHARNCQEEATHANHDEGTTASVNQKDHCMGLISDDAASEACKAVSQLDCQGTANATDSTAGQAQHHVDRPDASCDMQTDSSACHPTAATVATSGTDVANQSSILQHIISFGTTKRNNLHLLDDTLILGAGTFVLFLHVPTMRQQYLPGRDDGGIAAVAVHPSKQYFMVAEQSRSRAPHIYIYQYPSLSLVQTLSHGTEQAYSCAVFSPDGSMLASVGSAPDFTLTLWDWQAASTLLRCKAFSQEVYNVRFSPYHPGSLITSGTGHIRFWSMATTFTGLKLQGEIGRFGALELSDIAAFVELPDGKVLSGCESGNLLLWDGGLVKTVIMRPGGAPCHHGPIEVMHLDTNTNYIITGGGDGMLCLWDLNKISSAEAADGTNVCSMKPAAEVALPGGGCLRGLIWDKRGCFVVSDAGLLFKLCLPLNLMDQKGYVVTKLLELHSGPILGAFTCPHEHVVITVTGDGKIRALDYRAQQVRVLQQRQFSSQATCACMLPVTVDPQQRTVVLGFADGTLRMVRRFSDGWSLLAAVRPHQAQVSHVCVSPDGQKLAVAAVDGHVFFFSIIESSLQPELMCVLPGKNPTCCCWSANCTKLLFGFNSGSVAELTVPVVGSTDCSRTFGHAINSRCRKIKLPQQLRASQQTQAVTTDTDAPGQRNREASCLAAGTQTTFRDDVDDKLVHPITQVAYTGMGGNKFHVWLGGQAAGQVLECDWEQADPLLVSSSNQSAAVTAMNCSWSEKYKITGSENGLITITRTASDSAMMEERVWQCSLLDMRDGHITAVCMAYDDSCLVIAASDGTLFLLQNPLSPEAPAEASEGNSRLPSMTEDAARWADTADIEGGAPTLEQAKQTAHQHTQTATAASARYELVNSLATLRTEQAALVAANDARPAWERLQPHMLEVDSGVAVLVEQESKNKLADARAQVAYVTELSKLKLDKLQIYFMSNLEVHHLSVHDVCANTCVTSMRQAGIPIYGREGPTLQCQQPRSSMQQRTDPLIDKVPCQHRNVKQMQSEGADLETSSPGLPAPDSSLVLSRAELWRQAKKQRSAEWAAFLADKPNENFEAPADVTALAEAAASIGDYKLKTDPGFVQQMGEHLRPAKKAQQILTLMNDVSAAETRYNGSVMALKQQKTELLEHLNKAISRLTIIQSVLGPTDASGKLQTLSSEVYKKILDASAATDCSQGRGQQYIEQAASGAACIPTTPLTLDDAELRKLYMEQAHWLDDIARKQSIFNVSLTACRSTRLELAVSLKATEAQLLLMSKELSVLQEAEVHELAIESKHAAKAQEQAELLGKMLEVNQVIDDKMADHENATARRTALVAEFEVSTIRHETFKDQLSRVFYRKLKRNQRSAYEEESESEASADEDFDFEDSNDEDGGEVCPPGCDPTLYEHVVELRDKRLDEEDMIAEIGKSLEGIKKERELIARKVKIVEQSLCAIHQSVVELQQEKQARLNQLPAITNVRLHQVWEQEKQKLPSNLSDTLIFSQQQWSCLKQRMQELDEERHALKQHQIELQRQHKQLEIDQSTRVTRLSELDSKCRDVQLLKFGETIDTALLDTIGIRNKEADELRRALKQQAIVAVDELSQWELQIASKKQELLARTTENTAGLSIITDHSNKQRALETAITANRSSLWSDPYGARKATLMERNKLVSLIHQQAKVLDNMRSKILLMRRKDVAIDI